MNRTINRLGAELVIELTKSNPEDYQKFKLMMLSHEKKCKEKDFLEKVFLLAEERRPLLLTVK